MRRLPFAALIALLVPAIASAQKPRDFTKLDGCKILTTADIAAATNGKVMSTSKWEAGAVGCMWLVDEPAGTDTYQLFVHKPELYDQNWKVFATGTPVSGPWSAGDLTLPGPDGKQFVLLALKRGDVAVEVHGLNKDAVISLTKTALSRLQ
jgi:hypothetical protein